MKELSIEEKARAYDEALERVKELLSRCRNNRDRITMVYRVEDIESIFPELKKSEDEKIKEDLIQWISDFPDMIWSGHYREDVITWLEKQGEQKPTLPKWKYKNDNTPLLRDSLILNKYGCVAKSPSGAFVNDVWVIDYDELAKLPKEELEKQGEQETLCDKCRKEHQSHSCQDITELGRCYVEHEQKTDNSYCQENCKGFQETGKCFADGDCKAKREAETIDNKFKPKFKVGDWICNDACDVHIASIENGMYYFDEGDGLSIVFVDEHYHLWTIEDAMDGDVLCCESGWTCIFKTLNSDNISFSSYCFMDNTGWFCETGSESHTLEKAFIKAYNGEIYPATKEQRDLLFQKMKEAGYIFDFEKKELKKLSQPEVTKTSDQEEIAEISFGAKDSELQEATYYIPKGFHAEVDDDDDKVVIKKGEKPTTWSEDDEHRVKDTIYFLDTAKKHYASTVELDACIDWLKSIKDKHTWKPSEEQIKVFEHFVRSIGESGYVSPCENNTKLLYSLLEQLKKL